MGDGGIDSAVLLEVIQCSAPLTIVSNSTIANCGASDGSASVTVTGGIGPFTYLWSPGGATTATLTNIPAGTYVVKVDDGLSCSAPVYDTIVVGGTAITPPNIPANINVCSGKQIPNLVFSSNTPRASFSWLNSNPAIGLSASGTGNIPAFTAINSSTSPVQASVSVWSSLNGCNSDTIKFSITVTPGPNVSAGTDTVINCVNKTINITAASQLTGAIYSWLGSMGFSSNNAGISINLAGQYIVMLTDPSTACKSWDTLMVKADTAAPAVHISFPGDPCFRDTAHLVAQAAGQNIQYNWTGPQNFNSSLAAIQVNVEGTYTLVVKNNSNGCTAKKTTEAWKKPMVIVNSASICKGESATLTASGTLQYTWLNGLGNNPVIQVSPEKSCTLTVIGVNSHGCSDTARSFVKVNIPDPVNFILSNDMLNEYDPLVSANGILSAGLPFFWTINKLDTIRVPAFVKEFNTPGEYQICLQQQSANGCWAKVCKGLQMETMWGIYFPKAFSPNADNLNDTYEVKGYNISDFEIWIFDRWGNLLYYSNDLTKTWDGKCSSNSQASVSQEDVYVYKSKYRDLKLIQHQVSGIITLIR